MSRLQRAALDEIALPSGPKAVLTELLQTLDAQLGDQIVSCALYGSAARGEWVEATSDLNLFLILDHASFQELDTVGDAFTRARKRGRVVPLVMTTSELQGASDVFCVKFDAIRQDAVTLIGSPPFDSVEIDRSKMRFVTEFQLRNIALRLRLFFLQSHGSTRIEQDVLMRFFTAALPSLRALATLHGERSPTTYLTDFSPIQRALNVDTSVLESLARVHARRERLEQAALVKHYQALANLVHQAVEHVDKLPEEASR